MKQKTSNKWHIVNIESQKLSDITKNIPTQIKIFDDLMNKKDVINKIRNKLIELYPNVNLKDIIHDGGNITNKTTLSFSIYF